MENSDSRPPVYEVLESPQPNPPPQYQPGTQPPPQYQPTPQQQYQPGPQPQYQPAPQQLYQPAPQPQYQPAPQPQYQPAPQPQYPGQNVAYQPNQPQVVYIQPAPSPDVRSNYKGPLSVGFGITVIILQTVALIFNGVSFGIQLNRHYESYYNVAIIIFPAGWGCVLVYLAGAFMIAAGKTKTKCMIITNLVLSIIASVFVFMLIGATANAITSDATNLRYSPDSSDRASMALSVLLFLVAVTMFIIAIWSSTLSCRVCCCNSSLAPCENIQIVQTSTGGATGGVVYPTQYPAGGATTQYPAGGATTQYPTKG